MKRLFLSLIVALFALSISAKVIDVNKAKEFAKTFIEIQKSSSLKGEMQLVYTAKSKSKAQQSSTTTQQIADFYVFNKGVDEGFVIVTADDAIGEEIVLGYTDNGTFDYDALPESAKWWLSQYQAQMDSLRAHGLTAPKSLHKNNESIGTVVVPPLLGDNLWDQYDPYNRFCPEKRGAKTVTGCVATSMAQVMWYWKWPLQGKGSNSYTWNGQTLSANFEESTYEWDKILARYNEGFTEEQANAVAKLMYDCGIATKMNYGTGDEGGSSAYSNANVTALKNYFKYSSSTKYYSRTGSSTDWDNKLKGELNERRPILYGGVSDEGGHAFVCDGYTSSNYFHFNFGWSGSGNGFYLSSLTDLFATGQHATMGIKPMTGRTEVNGITYVIKSENEVEVTFSDVKNYSGDIVIPDTVTIGENLYYVTSIGNAAFNDATVTSVSIPATVTYIGSYTFSRCPNLAKVIVKGDEPIKLDNLVFDTNALAQSVLEVPAGKTEAYSSVLPWQMFTTITDGTDSLQWTAWAPEKDGVGTYKTAFYYYWSEPIPVKVYSRLLVTDSNKAQYKIDDCFYGASLFITCDKETGDCTLPKQSLGVMVNNTQEIFVSDYPTYNPNNKYKYYPCKFDSEIGQFSLRTIYYNNPSTSFANGTDVLLISGYPVYSVAVDTVYSDTEGNVTCNLELGKDVQKYSYLIQGGNLSKTQVQQYVDKVEAGTITPEYGTASTIKAKLNEPGVYTIIVMTYGISGSMREHDFKSFNYESSKDPEWVAKYEGTYLYSVWEKVTQEKVVAYQDKNKKSSWKLTPMYGGLEFFFRWDQTNNIVEFDEQTTAFEYKGKSVTVNDYKNYKASAQASYYNSADKKLCFNTYYVSGKFNENGFETYTITKTIGGDVIKGDANADGLVDVADITTIASYILIQTVPATGWNAENADANSDGKIDVADITATASIILGN